MHRSVGPGRSTGYGEPVEGLVDLERRRSRTEATDRSLDGLDVARVPLIDEGANQ